MSTLPNPRREKFAQYLALGMKPAEAGREVGASIGAVQKWAHHPQVKKRVNEIKAAAARKTVMDLVEMQERLTEIARGDLTDFIEIDEDGEISVRISGNNTAALAGLDITESRNGQSKKLRVRDPIAAMDLLAKLQKLYDLPPSYQDNRQVNIVVADNESKDVLKRIMSGERAQK